MIEPISALVWGHPKTRKSSFALSCPGPIHVFDFDQGVSELTVPCHDKHDYSWWNDHMSCRVYQPSDDVEPAHVTLHDMSFETFDPDLAEQQKLLTRYESRYMKMLQGAIPCRTVVVDTDSQWMKVAQPVKVAQALAEARAKGAKRTEPQRTDYGKYNQYRETTILKAKAAGVNLILIERAQEIWATDDEGKNPSGTGQYRPKGSADTAGLVQLVIRMEKQQLVLPGKPAQTMYMGVVEDSRFKGAKVPVEGRAFKDLTYDKLVKALFGDD